MTFILGLNTFHADSAAALLRDGHLVAAVAEERLNRVKHFSGFPELAVRECLRIAAAPLEEVEHVAIARDARANLLSKLAFAARDPGRASRLARQRLENRAQVTGARELLKKGLSAGSGRLRARVHTVEHHLAHVASAFLASPFEAAALQSLDGLGDFASTLSGVGEGNRIKVFDRILFPHSLGYLYTAVCQFIGFDEYGDEGKVMGLAPYGEDAYRDVFDRILLLGPSGRFELNLDWFVHHTEGVDCRVDEIGRPKIAPLFSHRFSEAFGPPRTRHAEITQRDRDLACSLQAAFERGYFHVLRALHRRTGLDTLCLAGGCTMNSVANGKIFRETPFRRVFVQPAATDDGTALGAALLVWNVVLKRARSFTMEHAFAGPEFEDAECERALLAAGLSWESLDDAELCRRVAGDLAEGKVVGWFQGRMEWGPRALGARSILAHPGHPRMRDILNERIKHREAFRPFAPSVLEEKVGLVFEQDQPDPFMLTVSPIRQEWRQRLCAVSHVDHTGRLQTVSKATNPLFHRLISEFEGLTGLPAVLNTSFNENEPIVCRPEEAVECFRRTRMDALALGKSYVRRQMRPGVCG